MNTRTALVAAAVAAAVTLLAVATPVAVSFYDVPLVAAFVLVLAHVGALPAAVLRPLAGAALSITTAIVLQLVSSPEPEGVWPWWVVLIISQSLVLFLVALRGTWSAAVLSWIGAVGASAVLVAVVRPEAIDPGSVNVVVFASISGGLVVIGIVLAQWHAIRGQLLVERSLTIEEHSRRMLAEDRARIARELHDVVAHGLSLINVQSTTVAYRKPGLDPEALAEFAEIATSSRQALGEMRSLLGVLRDEGPAPVAPQPQLARIEELLAAARRSGNDVTLRAAVALEDIAVSDLVGLTAYRIVQEALSNAVRHAPRAPVRIEIGVEAGVLEIVVRNPASPQRSLAAPGGGYGLVGMAERAASVGGRVEAGPEGDGGFRVHATLPVRGGGS